MFETMDRERLSQLLQGPETPPQAPLPTQGMIADFSAPFVVPEELRKGADEIQKRLEQQIDEVNKRNPRWDPDLDKIRFIPGAPKTTPRR